MTTLTIRLPDEKAARLRVLARDRGVSVSRLMEELSSIGLVGFDAEERFKALAGGGSAKEGLRLLDELEAAFAVRESL